MRGGVGGFLDAAISDEDTAFFHNDGRRDNGALKPAAFQNAHDAAGVHRGPKLALDGELIGFDGMCAIDLRLPLDENRACADATGAGFLHGQAHLSLAAQVAIENSLDSGRTADDPVIAYDSLGAEFQVAAGVHGAGDAFVDRDIDQFDRCVATGTNRALGFLRDLMGASALEAMDRLALTGFFAGKGRQ